jgi:site-specific DNA recombinase
MKKAVISSMYPENLTFDGIQYRTIRVNEVIRIFDDVKAVFGAKNKGKPAKKLICPIW